MEVLFRKTKSNSSESGMCVFVNFLLLVWNPACAESQMNRPLPSLLCASVSRRVLVQNLSYEDRFDLHKNEPVCGTHFHMTNGIAPRFVLTQSQKASRKWPIWSGFLLLLITHSKCARAFGLFR